MAIGNLFGSGGESNSLYGTSLSNGGAIPDVSSFIYFEWFIFKVSASQPATPTGGTWDFLTNTGTPPTGWASTEAGIPLDNLWFSIAFVDSRNPTNVIWSEPGLISAATSVYATAYADTFTGTGSTTVWTLTSDPVVVANLDVSINGVTQTPTVDYTISGTTFTTTTAAPLGSILLVKYRQALPNSYFGTANNVGYTPHNWIAATNVQAALNEVADDISAVDGVSGSNLVGYLPAGTGAVPTNVQDKLRQTVSVMDFGAVGDGVTDDTASFQAALDAAKGANGTAVGRTVFSLYVPNVPGGFYKITSTLIIDGTNGLHIYGDGALTQRETSSVPAGVIRWYGASSAPIFQLKGQTGVPSNPNFLIKISDLTMTGYASQIVPGSVPATLALSGIHIGALDGQNQNTLMRNLVIDNVHITNCRFGIWSGTPDALNTDHALVNITNSYITRNAQAGIVWGTGNALASVRGNFVALNGWGATSFAADAYMPQKGANVYVNSGYVDLVSLTTAGADTYAPYSADVYQESGRVSIINAWSDTEGFFFYQAGASTSGGAYQVGQITGVRHYNSSFTLANTPTSMRILAPGTTVSSCTVYGDIDVASGASGKPVFSGINFIRSGTGFIGTGVQTQRSLIDIGHGAGNYAQMFMGGADSGVALTHKGNKVPQLLSMGTTSEVGSVLQALGPASTSSGWQVQLEETTGQFRILVNGYFSGTDSATPLNSARAMFYVTIGGSTNLMTVWSYDPNGSASEVALSAFTKQGGFLSGNSAGLRSEVAFQAPLRAAAPTYANGDYWKGSIYYNTTTNKLQVNTGASTWVDLN